MPVDAAYRKSVRRLVAIAMILLLATAAVLLAPGDASAKGKGNGKGKSGAKKGKAYAPPKGKIFAGISDTGQTSDFDEYSKRTGSHPAVMQSFESWGYIPNEALRRWEKTRTRGMISLSTSRCWGCDAEISSEAIAQGASDRYLLELGRALTGREKPTYLRLFPEMNGWWNGYSAFNGSGKPKKDVYSTANFKKAWKRIVLILRGGKRAKINRSLKKLGLPKIQTHTKKKLPRPKLAVAWVPQSTGSPNVPGNAPKNYFPGYRYVDWVGADVYGKFENLGGMSDLYRKYRKVPFMVGEWSTWDRDDPGFVSRLFKWVERKGRAKMAVYYQGFGEGTANDFEIGDYAKSAKKLKRTLNKKRYLSYAPEEKPGKKKSGKGKKG